MSKNLAKFHRDHLYDDEYEGFGVKFEKSKKKVNETVDVTRSKNVTRTRSKPKDYENYSFEEDYTYE